jgi:hypothetical protein
MATLKYYDTATSEWKTLIVGAKGEQGDPGADGADGSDGADGETGPTGATGPGVAAGGTTGQFLTKIDGTNFNTTWVSMPTSIPFAQASGEVTVGGASVVTVTFPVGRFTIRPNITFGQSYVLASGGNSTGIVQIPYLHYPNTTSFGVILQNSNGDVAVWWHAIQMTASTASG